MSVNKTTICLRKKCLDKKVFFKRIQNPKEKNILSFCDVEYY